MATTSGHPWIKEQIIYKELIREVAHRSGIPQKACRKVLRAFFDAVKHHIFKLNYVRLPKFGAFFTKKQRGRLMVLGTGEKIWVGDRLAPKFIFFPAFRYQIRSVKPDEAELDH